MVDEQSWTLDKRGNRTTFVGSMGVPPVTTTQNRAVANGANEYGQFTINSTPGSTPGYDTKGNLTGDPYAKGFDGSTGHAYTPPAAPCAAGSAHH